MARAGLAGIDAPSVRTEAGRLEELRLAALEARAEALLECGKFGDAIAELETLTAAHPLRERLWSLRMLALYRACRQAEALRAYRDLRAILAGELAIEPGRHSATCTPASCARTPPWIVPPPASRTPATAAEGSAASHSPSRRPATR